MPAPLFVTFAAGLHGGWRIDRVSAVTGDALLVAPRLEVREGLRADDPNDTDLWRLRGTTSNLRYTTSAEHIRLTSVEAGLGRRTATRAALIPIRKVGAWWELSQDERRAIFEDRSHHIAVGLRYLPAVARRLHHSRELGEEFDFLTWFEYAPADSAAFEELVARLRQTEEWRYVDREVDVRLSRDGDG
jgi:hypothetical protein